MIRNRRKSAAISDRPNLLLFFTYGVSLKEWDRAGIVSREVEIYRKLIEKGFDVTFFTYGDESDLFVAGVPGGIKIVPAYMNFRRPSNRFLRFFHSLTFSITYKNIFKSADIYKTNQMSAGLLAALCRFLYRKPLVVRCGFEMLRSTLREGLTHLKLALMAVTGYLFESIVYIGADKIIISNKTDMIFVRRYFPAARDKSFVLMNYIDTRLFFPALHLTTNNRILFVGRLEKCKNLHNIISASGIAGVGLDIIGDGPLRKNLEDHALKEGVNVFFYGKIRNGLIPEIMRQYRFFILASEYEGNPKSLLEAMACGLVVIGSDVEGIRELIDDGRTGFLCETAPDSIAEVLKTVLNMEEYYLNHISQRARNFVLSGCSIDNTVEFEKKLYLSLLFPALSGRSFAECEGD